VARWTLISAALAPILLIGGWTAAAARQTSFDPLTQTISALAALEARERWIMTCALFGLGLCHMTTAFGLRAAPALGRATLALGGFCTLLVAAFPLSLHSEGREHVLAASAAFLCLAIWPLFGLSCAPAAPPALRPRYAVLASLVLLGMLAWLGWALEAESQLGLAERMAAGAEAIWPLLVALSVRRDRRS
jgi:hypothetical membrane protein